MATVTRRLAALLGASGAGLTDSATSSQITTTSLKDDAVTSAKIGTDQVGADALSSSAISGAVDIPANSVGESELSIDLSAQSVPHIIPGVLQPAIAGKLLNGADHSGAYGTPQTQSGGDGHSYYYTDIKGSKPIKDPRIGGHFGSQRHKIKSLQLLEQETATQGNEVYSLDGRKWLRLNATTTPLDFNRADGRSIGTGASGGVNSYFEIVGYFSDMNLIGFTQNSDRGFNVKVDGGTATAENNSLEPSINSPLGTESSGRYVDAGAVVNLGLNQTLGIHTVRVTPHASGDYVILYGIELIVQDTASTARRSEIKIPKQNVVSFGKKFEVGSDDLDNAVHPHYDPFNGFTNGTTTFGTKVDTATSLGLGEGTTYGAPWAISSSNHIRPFNGGRVVKWVDSDGTIKTSVTMMPRNAQNWRTTASNEINPASATNSDTINFSDDAVDYSLTEVAKTYHVREFGNGSANGNASWLDVSTMTTSTTPQHPIYVMDDGTTSIVVRNGRWADSIRSANGNVQLNVYVTFIGTGFSCYYYADINYNSDIFVDGVKVEDSSSASSSRKIEVQNLPYGTHVILFQEVATTNDNPLVFATNQELTIFQPKRPPIPEDCVVLADYMLMADFVQQTVSGLDKLSKGTRLVSGSRDVFFNGGSFTFGQNSTHAQTGFKYYSTAGAAETKLPFFGTGIVHKHESNTSDGMTMGFTNDGTNFSGGTFFGEATSNQLIQTSASSAGMYGGIKGLELGTYNAKFLGTGQSGKVYRGTAFEVATPIHTSHHYQVFETPFLHELVGGDRNMEQTNLVVSPDGKIWDEVTRDTSYIGDIVLNASTDTETGWSSVVVFDEWRGQHSSYATHFYTKYFAIAYDSLICLQDGEYALRAQSKSNASGGILMWSVNGLNAPYGYTATSDEAIGYTVQKLKRGDVVKLYGEFGYDVLNWSQANIIKLN